MKKASEMLQHLIPEAVAEPPPQVVSDPDEQCQCDGSGMVFIEDAAGRRVRECFCKIQKRIDSRLKRAEIPERFRGTTLDNYNALGGHASLGRGLATARRYVAEYPIATAGRGVLFVGPVGVGKTHLAVGMVRALILDKGAQAIFVDFRELLNKIKGTFGSRDVSEGQVLAPIFAADVLVLDELGAARQTDWSSDAVENIINGRYNANKSTIITTNLPNLGPGATAAAADDANSYAGAANPYAAAARQSMRTETLGDRIGARMHSRLQQMCITVEMTGEDYRAKKGKR